MFLLPRRRFLAALLAAGAAAGVSGCGFQPVYMPTFSGKAGPAERGLAATEVALIPERPGQLLRQALQARFESVGGSLTRRFSLAVNYSIAGEGLAIYADNSPTRIRFIGTANWTLYSLIPAGSVTASGSARAFDALDLYNQQYFAVDLEAETIQRRLAREIAARIAMQLAVWFREHPDQAG